MKHFISSENMLHAVDQCIAYAILAMVFFLALSPEITAVALCIGAAAWAVKLIALRGSCFRRTPFDLPILCFALISAASIFVSPDSGFSFYNYYNLMGRYMLVYYLVVQNITTMEALKRLVYAMAAAALVVVAYGFYQFICGIDISGMRWVDGEQFPELKTRVFSTMANPNILAGYLIVMMSMALGLICKMKAMRCKLMLGAFFLLLGVCLSMTYSRGALLSLLLVVAGYGVMKNRKVLIGVLLLGALVYCFDAGLTQRLLSSFDASDTSSSMRLALWESTVAMIVEHPLLGIGWGAYFMVYPYYDFFIQNDAVVIVHAHNMYLNFAAEIGLAGCLSFVVCMVGHLWLALSSTRLRQSDTLNGLTLGGAFAIFAMMINGLTDYVLFNIELSMLYWLISALIVIICRRSLD